MDDSDSYLLLPFNIRMHTSYVSGISYNWKTLFIIIIIIFTIINNMQYIMS